MNWSAANKAPRRKQRGIKSALQTAGFQPAFAPRGEELKPEEIKIGRGCQGFHFPLLMEFSRAQPPFGNLPMTSSLRLPRVIQVTLPSRSRTGKCASGCGKYIFSP